MYEYVNIITVFTLQALFCLLWLY